MAGKGSCCGSGDKHDKTGVYQGPKPQPPAKPMTKAAPKPRKGYGK